LEGQAKRLQDYCAAKGYPIAMVVKEIGSGVNETRPELLKLLNDPAVTLIMVEHKDRLTRFGFDYIEQLLKLQDRSHPSGRERQRSSGRGFCQPRDLVLCPTRWATPLETQGRADYCRTD
jgi:DNA invertase Pin-like site-specific DNA recombinase